MIRACTQAIRRTLVTNSRRSISTPSCASFNPYDFLPSVPSFEVTSTDVKEGEILAAQHTSAAFGMPGGEDLSPQLSWSGFPAETKSFVVTCYDPDAAGVTGSGFWHWCIYDIPADVTELATGAGSADGKLLPAGAIQTKNCASIKGFLGAAPPPNRLHRYIFCVTALGADSLPIGNPDDVHPTVVGFNMFGAGDVLARAFITPTFSH